MSVSVERGKTKWYMVQYQAFFWFASGRTEPNQGLDICLY